MRKMSTSAIWCSSYVGSYQNWEIASISLQINFLHEIPDEKIWMKKVMIPAELKDSFAQH